MCAAAWKTEGPRRHLVFERLDPLVQRVRGSGNEWCDTNVELLNDSAAAIHKPGCRGRWLTAFLRVRVSYFVVRRHGTDIFAAEL